MKTYVVIIKLPEDSDAAGVEETLNEMLSEVMEEGGEIVSVVSVGETLPMKWTGEKKTDWQARSPGSYIELHGKHCYILLECRPYYCDRGNFLARIFPKPGATPEDLWIDGQDGWPRYYFDESRAKLECEAWMEKRGQNDDHKKTAGS